MMVVVVCVLSGWNGAKNEGQRIGTCGLICEGREA